MEVKISFDIEKDTIEDFKKLEAYIQNIIKEKGGQPNIIIESVQQRSQQSQQKPRQGATARECRIVEYKDMSNEISEIFSGKKKKRGF